MNTTQLKSTLHTLIERINDDAVLQAYVVLLSREAEGVFDFWDNLDTPTQAAIQEGLQDLNAGRKTDFFDFMKSQYGINR